MKISKTLFVIVVVIVSAACFSKSAEAAKWKGSWYLRGTNECKEIVLDRKGRSEIASYPKAIVEKRGDEHFLSVEKMGKKYSYEMTNCDGGYSLELVSIGPNLPLISKKVSEEATFVGMYRLLIDCQMVYPPLTETNISK